MFKRAINTSSKLILYYYSQLSGNSSFDMFLLQWFKADFKNLQTLFFPTQVVIPRPKLRSVLRTCSGADSNDKVGLLNKYLTKGMGLLYSQQGWKKLIN